MLVSLYAFLMNSSCVPVFILSVLFLKEAVSILKVVSVLTCVGGVVLVSFEAGSDSGYQDTSFRYRSFPC